MLLLKGWFVYNVGFVALILDKYFWSCVLDHLKKYVRVLTRRGEERYRAALGTNCQRSMCVLTCILSSVPFFFKKIMYTPRVEYSTSYNWYICFCVFSKNFDSLHRGRVTSELSVPSCPGNVLLHTISRSSFCLSRKAGFDAKWACIDIISMFNAPLGVDYTSDLTLSRTMMYRCGDLLELTAINCT